MSKKTAQEKIRDIETRISKRNKNITSQSDYNKKRKLEIQNEIDKLKIRIENYKDFMDRNFSK
jgi:hypothetical protein